MKVWVGQIAEKVGGYRRGKRRRRISRRRRSRTSKLSMGDWSLRSK